MLAYPPLLHWHHCQHPTASLPAFCWNLCRRSAGVSAAIALALLPLLHWRHCNCCAGVVAVIALALLPLLHQCCCQHRAGIFGGVLLASTPLSCWGLCCRFAGVAAVIVPALLPLLQIRLLPLLHLCSRQHCAGIFAGIPLASLPLSCWRLHHHLAGTAAVTELPLLLCWHCCRCHTHVAASIVRALCWC